MLVSDTIDLSGEHAWIVVASLAIGAIVRLLKSDSVLPFKLRSEWRPILAFALGIGAGVLDRIATGETWSKAILGGVMASLIAMVGHNFAIEWLRGGREIAIPWLTKKDE